MIQQSAFFVAIRKGVTNRMVQELTKLAEGEPERYAKIWEYFGAVPKEGLYEDPERRDALFSLARFATTTHPAGDRTLADYSPASREPDGDLLSDRRGRKRLAASPQLEGFRARDVEVLLLADPVDAFWVSSAVGFDGKPFKSVSQGAPTSRRSRSRTALGGRRGLAEVATLIAFFKQTLEGEIAEARASDRLTDSLACLVAPEFAPDRQLEKILAAHGRLGERAKAVLEVNASHPLVQALAKTFAAGPDKALVVDAAWLIYEEARLLTATP